MIEKTILLSVHLNQRDFLTTLVTRDENTGAEVLVLIIQLHECRVIANNGLIAKNTTMLNVSSSQSNFNEIKRIIL